MSNLDVANDFKVTLIHVANIPSNGTTFSASFNVSDSDGGFYVTAFDNAYSDGTFTFTLQDSPDDSVWTDVPTEKLNDPQGTGNFVINSLSALGENLGRLGAFSVNKFIRAKIVASGVSGGAVIFMTAHQKLENTPVP